MRITIDINDDLLGKLRHSASQTNRSFKEALSETLQRGLANNGYRQSGLKFVNPLER